MAGAGKKITIIGAGPSGLMAAYELQKAGFETTVLEAENQVGGLATTHKFQGTAGDYRFDLGGHRFISDNPQLLRLIENLMGNDLLHTDRKSVIRLAGKTYAYPLSLSNLLLNAPTSMLAGAAGDLLSSPFRAKQPQTQEHSFAQWVEQRFGPTLYDNFFDGYATKLWGIPPEQLSADWAEHRISLLDLKDVFARMLHLKNSTPRTYAKEYRYPKWGIGSLFERLAEAYVDLGGELLLNSPVLGVRRKGDQITEVQFQHKGRAEQITNDWVIGTLPLPVMASFLLHNSGLKYRALRFINLPVKTTHFSENTWQYLSDEEIMATRLQEPRKHSPFMSPKDHSSAMLEVPCNEGDDVWHLDHDTLYRRMMRDLRKLRVDTDVFTGEIFTANAAHAYPLLEVGYQKKRAAIFDKLNQIDNLIMCGRQGTFRYISTDTAMEMGMMTAQSIINHVDDRARIHNHTHEKNIKKVTA